MKHIMLSFLSTISLTKENNIDFKACPELVVDGLGEMVHCTNESCLRYILNAFKKISDQKLDYYVCFVSEEVRNKIICQERSSLNCVHLDYFKNRVQEILNVYYPSEVIDAENFVKTINYTVQSNQDASVNDVLQVINSIKEIQKVCGGEDLIVHLDLTGGPRNANMLLLMISRMLEYDKSIRIEKVLYANYLQQCKYIQIETISDAYLLLDFVAGMSEFVNFGSMKALNQYFEIVGLENQSESLQGLLEAMQKFADMIMLCRYGEFVKAIEILKEKMDGFVEYYQKCERKQSVDTLLYKIIPTVYSKYQLLFSEEEKTGSKIIKDLAIIKWCYENNHIQQTMTLITERIPKVLFNEDDPYLEIAAEEAVAVESRYKIYTEQAQKDNEVVLDKECWLMFKDAEKFELGTFKSKLEEILREYFVTVRKRKDMVGGFEDKLDKLENNYNCTGIYNREELYQNMLAFQKYFNTNMNGQTVITEADCVIVKNFRQFPEFATMKLTDFIKRYDSNQITSPNGKGIFEICGGHFNENYFDVPGNFANIRDKLRKGILETRYDKQKLTSLIRLYYEIKKERNAVNHAHDKKETITLSELRSKIKMLVDGLIAMSIIKL